MYRCLVALPEARADANPGFSPKWLMVAVLTALLAIAVAPLTS